MAIVLPVLKMDWRLLVGSGDLLAGSENGIGLDTARMRLPCLMQEMGGLETRLAQDMYLNRSILLVVFASQ